VSDQRDGTGTSLYDAAGGMPFFERLVDRFYDAVADDPVLLPLYPEAPDLTGARRRLTLFLAQYWGGPLTYNEERGHPRLRMRHMDFSVGSAQRDHWLTHMIAAVDELAPTPEIAETMRNYFVPTAEAMRNDPGLRLGPVRP
jgi:hemoglobin